MKPIPQIPGELPKGYSLDSLLTVDQFATWRQIALTTAKKKLPVTPGVIAESREDIRVHPRTYLDMRLKKFTR